jgi:hypothetical protein
MSNRIKLGIVVAGALGLLPMSAAHANITFNACENATCITATGATSVSVPTTTVGDYSVSGFGQFFQPPLGGISLLGTNTLDVTSTNAAADLIIKITATGLTNPSSATAAFLSSFGQNGLNFGQTSTGQTFIDLTNAGLTVTPLSSLVTFTNTDQNVGSGTFNTSGGPFSITAVYDIHPTAAASQASLNIAVAVPGPILGAGLPGLLAACGGLIALARRRRQQRA